MIEFVSSPKSRRKGPAAPTPSPLWFSVVCMLALAAVTYLPAALRAGFLAFDDNFFFGPDNPEFREGIAAVLDPRRPIANVWLPVSHLSLWFEFRLFGAVPFWPHLSALLWHAATAVLFVRLLLALGAQRGVAHVAGALFVVHPALAESVAWVSGRKDLLAGFFGLAALLQTVQFVRRPGWLRAIGIGLFGALAMYSKATAVVVPVLAVLLCLYTGGPRRRFLAPLVLLLVALPIAWHHQSIAAIEGTMAGSSVGEGIEQVPGALQHYLSTTFWPLQLNVLYPEVDTLAAFRRAFVPGAMLGLGVFFAALLAWRRSTWRLAAFGLLAFGVALLPFNTSYPASSIAAADRYLYFAVPGAATAVVAVLHHLLPRVGLWLAAALVLPLVYLAGSRAHDFGDDQSLWRSSLAVEPVNAVAHLNLVYDLLKRGPAELDVVRGHLEAAVAAARYPIHELRARQLLVRIAVKDADYEAAANQARAAIAAAGAQLAGETHTARRAQATALLMQAHLAAFEPLRQVGDIAGAEASCALAMQALPDHPDVIAFGASLELLHVAEQLRIASAAGGAATLADDDPRGAAADRTLGAALELHPEHPGLLCAQAAWDRLRDRALPALRNYRRAIAADPGCIDAWLGAARLLREREKFTDAESYARRGLEQRSDPALRQELALALAGQLRLDDAILQLEAYLRVRPQDQETPKVVANLLVGRAYARLGEGADAAEVLKIVEHALAYNPNEGKAHLVLGRLANEQRHFAAAVSYLATAFRMLPDFEDARQLYAQSLASLGFERLLHRDDEGASEAWLRCLEVAPKDFATDGLHQQMGAIWRRFEARGIDRQKAGDRQGAIADFRRCLALDPRQHWIAWLLACTLRDEPDAALDEVEQLCRQAVAWQQQHELDRSQQVLLLADTLARRGETDAARTIAAEYLEQPQADAKPQVLAALRRLAGS
ncbi:MAG: hypothetical protein ABIP94_06615 [Planctomycetota bacterium]